MEFRTVRALRGPNIWARFPVLEVSVDPGEFRGVGAAQLPLVADRIAAWLPGIADRVKGGGSLAEAVEWAGRELQCLAGSMVHFSRTAVYGAGDHRVVVQYREEEVGRQAMKSALDLVVAAVNG